MKLKQTISSVAAGVLSLSMVFAFTACGDNKPADPEITAIALDRTEASIATGETANLKVTATYSDSTTDTLSAGDVEWTSSKTDVATVTRGIVSGKAAGVTTVTAKVGEYTAYCAVTVYSLIVEISETSISVEKGETAQLTATVKKDGVVLPDEEIVWSSSDEDIAEVNDSGLIKAWVQGSANITAKRKNGSQSATCAVTVTWENKGEDVKTQMSITEQNKIKPNEWGYWADEGAWEFGNTKVNEMYTDSYTVDLSKYEPQGSGEVVALNQKVNLDFTVIDHSGRSGESNPYAQVQLAYRSAKNDSEYGTEDAMLLTNHNYKLTFKLDSNVAGEILVNPISFINVNADVEDYKVPPTNIVVGTNTVSLEFRHGDWGEIHPDGNYDNVESALFLQLGNLPLNTRAVISIYDIIWEDLGEAEVKTKLPNFGSDEEVDLPDLGSAEAIDFALSAENKDPGETTDATAGQYEITAGADGKSSTIEYTTYTTTYEALYIDISGNEAVKAGNTFAVTIKNNNDSAAVVRFDINGTEMTQPNNVKNCVLTFVTSKNGSGKVDEYGGTSLTVDANDEVTVYYTYSFEGHGEPDKIAVYLDTLWAGGTADNGWQGTQEERTGNITISGLKFASVINTTKSAKANDVELVKEGDNVYFVVTGTCKNYTLDELKAAHGLWIQSSDWDTSKDVHPTAEDVEVALNDDGTYEIKWNLANVAAGSYMGHLAPEFLGTEYGDLFHESEFASDLTANGKTYNYKNVNFDGWSRYCLTITEAA